VLVAGMACAVSAMVLGGCRTEPRASQGDPPQLVDSSRPYTGPTINHEIAAERHVFVASVPSGGWEVKLDREELIGREGRVFLTLVRPGRDEMVTQAFVDHRVETDLPSDRTVSLYARVQQRGRDANETGYALVRRITQ